MILAIFYFFLAYLLYQVVFRFVIPIWRATRQVRRSFRNMQEKMNGQSAAQPGTRTSKKSSQPQPKGDYIDFEEIREGS